MQPTHHENHTHCLSCGQLLKGEYCHHCGEKMINPKHDYSFFEFIEQTLDGFTHFDSKFLRSFKYLLLRPGLLTKEYIDGRRTKLMRPIQIFIIASVLFYFFMPRTSSFYESYGEFQNAYASGHFNPGNPFKYNAKAKLLPLAIKKVGANAPDSLINRTVTDIFYSGIEERAASLSKNWLFVVVPFWGLIIYALFYRRNTFYTPHLVFAMHLFSFFLIADLAFLLVLFNLLKFNFISTTTHLLPFLILMLAYIIIAVKRFYQRNMVHSLWKGAVVFFSLLTLLLFYRSMITTWVFYTS